LTETFLITRKIKSDFEWVFYMIVMVVRPIRTFN